MIAPAVWFMEPRTAIVSGNERSHRFGERLRSPTALLVADRVVEEFRAKIRLGLHFGFQSGWLYPCSQKSPLQDTTVE